MLQSKLASKLLYFNLLQNSVRVHKADEKNNRERAMERERKQGENKWKRERWVRKRRKLKGKKTK